MRHTAKEKILRFRIQSETEQELITQAEEFSNKFGVEFKPHQYARSIVENEIRLRKQQREANQWLRENPLGPQKTKKVMVRRAGK